MDTNYQKELKLYSEYENHNFSLRTILIKIILLFLVILLTNNIIISLIIILILLICYKIIFHWYILKTQDIINSLSYIFSLSATGMVFLTLNDIIISFYIGISFFILITLIYDSILSGVDSYCNPIGFLIPIGLAFIYAIFWPTFLLLIILSLKKKLIFLINQKS